MDKNKFKSVVAIIGLITLGIISGTSATSQILTTGQISSLNLLQLDRSKGYIVESECTTDLEKYNLEYPNYLRTPCYLVDDSYYYYLYTNSNKTDVEKVLGITANNTNTQSGSQSQTQSGSNITNSGTTESGTISVETEKLLEGTIDDLIGSLSPRYLKVGDAVIDKLEENVAKLPNDAEKLSYLDSKEIKLDAVVEKIKTLKDPVKHQQYTDLVNYVRLDIVRQKGELIGADNVLYTENQMLADIGQITADNVVQGSGGSNPINNTGTISTQRPQTTTQSVIALNSQPVLQNNSNNKVSSKDGSLSFQVNKKNLYVGGIGEDVNISTSWSFNNDIRKFANCRLRMGNTSGSKQKTIPFYNVSNSYVPKNYNFNLIKDLGININDVGLLFIVGIRCYTEEESILERGGTERKIEEWSQNRGTKVQVTNISIIKKDLSKPFWQCTTLDTNGKVWMRQAAMYDKSNNNTSCIESTKDDALKNDDQSRTNEYVCYGDNIIQFSVLDQTNSWLKCEKNKFYDQYYSSRPKSITDLKIEPIEDSGNIKLKINWNNQDDTIAGYKIFYSWDGITDYSAGEMTKDTIYNINLGAIGTNISNFKYYGRIYAINQKGVESMPIGFTIDIAKNSTLQLDKASFGKILEGIKITGILNQSVGFINQDIQNPTNFTAIYSDVNKNVTLRWTNGEKVSGTRLYISNDGGNTYSAPITIGYNSWYTINGLLGTKYKLVSYKLSEDNQIIGESKGVFATSKAQITSIDDVTNLKYSLNNEGKAVLSWNSVNNAAYYIIYVYVSSGGNNDPRVYRGTSESTTFNTGIEGGYKFLVKSSDGGSILSKGIEIQTSK